MLERSGSVIGPILLGAMISLSDFQYAFFIIGGMAMVIVALLIILMFWPGKSMNRNRGTV